MKEQDTIELIRKFIRNECSADELAVVNKVMRESIDEALWQKVLEEEQTPVENLPGTIDKEHAGRIYVRISAVAGLKAAPEGRQIHLRWLKWSASVAAAVVAGFLIFQQLGLRESAERSKLLVESTQHHQRKQLLLADGSRVWLNSESSIRYPAVFSSGIREVFLEGEAFFNVKKDEQKPFIVHAGKIGIKVLGTSFNVKSFDDETETTIALATGAVEVAGGENNTVQLAPGQWLTYNKANGKFHKTTADVSGSYAWREGVLQFESTPLRQVSHALERWYGIHISIEDPALAATRITLKQHDENLRDVLDILAFTARLKYTIAGDTVTLTKHEPTP